MCVSCVQLFVTPWTIARQAPQSMGFCRQEYWSGLPCPSSGDLPDPGMEETMFLLSPALAGRFLTTSTTWEALILNITYQLPFFFFTIAFPFTIIFLNKNVYPVLFNMYHMYIFICTYLNM